MKFKTWKEAEQRAAALQGEIDTLNTDIGTAEAEARKEDTTIERRDEIIKDLQAKVEKRNGLQAEMDDATDAAGTLKESEKRQFGLLDNLSPQRTAERRTRVEEKDKSVYETRSYELAWADYIRTGNDSECRALVSTQTGSGDVLVPKSLADKIEDSLMTGGRLINLCDMISINGITEYPVVNTKTDPELHDETGGVKKKEKEIGFLSITMNPQFVAEILRTSRKFEQDSISAFWDWIMAELPDALRRVIDSMILTGSQSANAGIHGILTNQNARFVATLANHVLNFNTANQAVAKLDDGVEDNVTVVMHRETFFNNVMGLVGTDGHPIWKQVSDNITNRPTFTMGGYPVVFSKDLPSYDTATSGEAYMVVGNFKAMKLNFPAGMNVQIIRDAITEMDDNIVRYLSEIYAAGNITKVGCFVKVTKE